MWCSSARKSAPRLGGAAGPPGPSNFVEFCRPDFCRGARNAHCAGAAAVVESRTAEGFVAVIGTTVDIASKEYRANAAAMRALVAELEQQRASAAEGGSAR